MTERLGSFEARAIDGKAVGLSRYEGNVVLVVNVASKCGFTPQYEGLEALYRKYKDRGFVVLGFPCNQFSAQEPGNETEIASFCRTVYDITFPLFAKIDVNGDATPPLWQWLKREKRGLLGTTGIKWNFTKFLVGRDGRVRDRFAPRATPDSFEAAIEEALIVKQV